MTTESESRMREVLESRVEELVKIACVKEANDAIEARREFNHTNCVRNAVRMTISKALSPPARRTSYEWVADGVTFRVYWFTKGRGDGLWAAERRAGDRWSPDFGLTTYAAAAIATLAGLTPPGGESDSRGGKG